MPGGVHHLHADQHIAGIELALASALDAVLDLNDLLGRDQDIGELVLQLLGGVGEKLLEGLLHAELIA